MTIIKIFKHLSPIKILHSTNLENLLIVFSEKSPSKLEQFLPKFSLLNFQ